jgi:Cu/Ag efflux pump CusA
VGMIPIAGEWAIGLERLSPLAVVAIGGLLVSTLLTLIYVPMFYDIFEKLRVSIARRFGRADVNAIVVEK